MPDKCCGISAQVNARAIPVFHEQALKCFKITKNRWPRIKIKLNQTEADVGSIRLKSISSVEKLVALNLTRIHVAYSLCNPYNTHNMKCNSMTCPSGIRAIMELSWVKGSYSKCSKLWEPVELGIRKKNHWSINRNDMVGLAHSNAIASICNEFAPPAIGRFLACRFRNNWITG